MKKHGAFTLIELLVVVAVLGILATLAAVNFAEASTRSKLARVRADIRTMEGALAMYRVDQGAYPPAAMGDIQLDHPLVALTSPVAYLTAVPDDPFGVASFDFAPQLRLAGYNYKDAATTSVGMPAETYGVIWIENPTSKYMLHSAGPNHVWDVTPYVEYDPTNGSLSRGDIARLGPM